MSQQREALRKVRNGESLRESFFNGTATVTYAIESDGEIYRYERGPDGQDWGSRRLPAIKSS